MVRTITLILGLLMISWNSIASLRHNYNNGQTFIFTEAGIEFAVYADGQFDFYLNNNNVNIGINTPNVNISFNSGYNYDPFVQYDDYGAVVQIENIPIFYDHFGRIIQAGDVFISYNRWNRVARIGELFINYNAYGEFLNYVGFINNFNRRYVYRPFHAYFSFPIRNRCVVYNRPYRRYYRPIRYSYTTYQTRYRTIHYNKPYRLRSYYHPYDRVSNYRLGQVSSSPIRVAYRNQDSRRRIHKRYDQVNRSRSYTSRNIANKRSIRNTTTRRLASRKIASNSNNSIRKVRPTYSTRSTPTVTRRYSRPSKNKSVQTTKISRKSTPVKKYSTNSRNSRSYATKRKNNSSYNSKSNVRSNTSKRSYATQRKRVQ